MTSRERLWRGGLIVSSAITLCFVLLYLGSMTFVPMRGDFPFLFEKAGPVVTITGFPPRFASHTQGLLAGDIIELDRADPAVLAALVPHQASIGTRLNLPILRGGRHIAVPIVIPSNRLPDPSGGLFVALADLWMLAFAFAIGMRNPKDSQARLLCAVLLAYALANSVLNATLPSFGFTICSIIFGNPGMALSAALFALFALRDVPNAVARAVLFSVSIATVVVTAIAATGLAVGIVTQSYPLYAFFSQPLAFAFLFSGHFAAVRGVAFICIIVGLLFSGGAARARLAWAGTPVLMMYGGSALWLAFIALGTPAAMTENFYTFVNFCVFLIPVGLTYAALSRRVFDIGFVVNRAVVFGVVSLFVISCFVLLEWALSEWVKGASHVTSLSANVILALALGISMRYIHGFVDRFVDQVLFKKRHEDERELRRFAREAGYITDAQTLLRRSAEVVERCADASFVTIRLEDGSGRFEDVDENDRAIVALRTWSERVDLAQIETTLKGEFAFPMVVRGRLIGAFAVGPKRSGESYAPDESDAIAHVALGVGNALEALGSRDADWRNAVLGQLRALPDAIAERLRTQVLP